MPTHDTCALTLRCLAALGASTHVPAEVIVVDDGSRDRTVEAIRAAHPGVRVVERAAAGGFTASVNEAWPLAASEIVLLLNSDAEVHPEALKGFAAAFAREPRLGIAAASLRHPDGRAQWSAGPAPSAAWFFALASGGAAALARLPGWRILRRESQAHTRIKPPLHARENGDALPAHASSADASFAGVPVANESAADASWSDAPATATAAASLADAAWVPATAMAVRHEVTKAIGMFDPLLRTYAQDLDYCVRARAAGWRVAQLPGVEVVHLRGATIGASADAVVSRQDPVALFGDLVRWIAKTHAPAEARRLIRAIAIGLRLRLAARGAIRWSIGSGADREAWDRDTARYRRALEALRTAR